MNKRITKNSEPSHTNEIAAASRAEAQPSPDDETSHEREDIPKPLIYVADLAAYNNGKLHGVWLDAARQPGALYDDIQRMLDASPENIPGISAAEEFAIHDFEGFGNCRIHEHDSIELVSKIARGIKEHGYAFAAWADVQEGEPELLDHFSKSYVGHYESIDALVQQRLDERAASTELDRLIGSSGLADLKGYITIDVAALARDMFLSGDINVYKATAELGGGMWLFDERA